MKKTVLIFGFLLLFASCTSGRVEELEEENNLLKNELVVLRAERDTAQRAAKEQMILAEMQAMRAQIAVDSAHAALAKLEASKK